MGAFLNLLLIIFLAGIFFVVAIAYRIYRSVHDAARQFRDFSGTGRNNTGSTQRNRHSGTDETIIDRRDSDKAKRRIFSDNEGEYVDFEEER